MFIMLWGDIPMMAKVYNVTAELMFTFTQIDLIVVCNSTREHRGRLMKISLYS